MFASIHHKYHSQASFSNKCCQESFWKIIFWCDFWRVILNEFCQQCLSEVLPTSVFRSVLRNVANNHSQAFFSNNLLKQLFSAIIFKHCFLMWFLEMNFEWVLPIMSLRTVGVRHSNNHSLNVAKCSFSSILLKQSSQTSVAKSHSERLFFDVILRDWFWMSVTNDVSENRRRQAFSEVFAWNKIELFWMECSQLFWRVKS